MDLTATPSRPLMLALPIPRGAGKGNGALRQAKMTRKAADLAEVVRAGERD